jgi:hypothetical protein
MLVSLTVGKVDAGVAVLLTQDNRLVSFHPLVVGPPSMGTVACDRCARSQPSMAKLTEMDTD